MNAIELNRYSQAWRDLGKRLPQPRSIVVVSAHWFVRGVAVTANERPRTIHDFGGFPRKLYEVEYPAPGDPALAQYIVEILPTLDVKLDVSWGLDHGAWSLLVHLYPDADVPVVELSIDATKTAEFHWALGTALARLRDEGVLILGSGNVVHNLELIDLNAGGGFDWAERFDERVRVAIESGDRETLVHYKSDSDGRLAVPTPEHYLPLLYVAALRAPGEPVETVVEGLEAGSLSMRSIAIG
jgi:4,5-DOPA dioxygenase extradiol